MIKLKDQNLSIGAIEALNDYQSKINAKKRYDEQVKEAQHRWNIQDRSKRHLVFAEIRQQLQLMCPGKLRCCYCEDGVAEAIEHFAPKTLYPELTFEWANYLLSCSTCNSSSKIDQFAVFDIDGNFHDVTRKKGQTNITPPIHGNPVLINPRFEDPLLFIELDFLTFHFQSRYSTNSHEKRKADYTIHILKLNERSELVDWRREACGKFINWIIAYQTYTRENPQRLDEHISDLKKYNHIAVWEEMRRIYRERNLLNWTKIKHRSPFVRDIDKWFTLVPEVQEISIQHI